MKKRFALLLLLLASLLLAGCESMSPTECKVADWGRVGHADGTRGESDRRIADYTEDCGKVGVIPNAQLYRYGWDQGIVNFCTPANGWREGLQGNFGKASVCQGQAGFAGFSRYLDAGLQVHNTQAQMQRNGRESERLQRRLEESKNDEEKKNIRNDLRHIDREQFRLRNQLTQQQMMGP
ncbi:MAG: DUF2799 domain-containing protein [Pseudomonadota bacterium]